MVTIDEKAFASACDVHFQLTTKTTKGREEKLRHFLAAYLEGTRFPFPVEGWQPIETAPANKSILVFYKNPNGKDRIIKARFIARFTREYEYDSDEIDTDYNEEADKYYWREGWYEQVENWDDYTNIAVTESLPTHWQPLPPAPKG